MSGRRAVGAYVAHIDGACSGNPGATGIGAVIRRADGTVAAELSKSAGVGTNNTAEYSALIAVLRWAHENDRLGLRVHSDSRLVVQQMMGRWRVKNREMRRLHREAHELAKGLPFFSIEWVPRGRNKDADRLAKQATG